MLYAGTRDRGVGRRFGFGKAESRAGRHSVLVVAGTAGGLLHDLVEARTEGCLLSTQGVQKGRKQCKTDDQSSLAVFTNVKRVWWDTQAANNRAPADSGGDILPSLSTR